MVAVAISISVLFVFKKKIFLVETHVSVRLFAFGLFFSLLPLCHCVHLSPFDHTYDDIYWVISESFHLVISVYYSKSVFAGWSIIKPSYNTVLVRAGSRESILKWL